MPSINAMVRRCAGLLGTGSLTAWESQFVASIVEQTSDGDNTTSLSESQIDALERIFEKHFAG